MAVLPAAAAVHEGPLRYDFPLWDRYFLGWTGRFGWGDYEFPEWVSVVHRRDPRRLLAGRALVFALRHRGAFLRRWPEWLSYLAIAGGLLFLLAYTGYGWKRDTGTDFEQGRYLLPLLALYAALSRPACGGSASGSARCGRGARDARDRALAVGAGAHRRAVLRLIAALERVEALLDAA